MKLISFRAINFKGIEDATVSMSGLDPAVYSFVGLNESGKTTILEALAAYNGWTETLKPVTASTETQLNHLAYVPKSSISNFTGAITIRVTCLLDDQDKTIAQKAARDLDYEVTHIASHLSRIQHFDFKDSKYVQARNQFNLEAKGYKLKSRKKQSEDLPVEVRRAMSDALLTRFPAVLYFPNAIFDTPDEIVLSNGGRATEKDVYYRQVLQDALDSLGKKLGLEQHITSRIGDPSQAESLQGAVKNLELKISQFVFKAWKDILGQDMPDSRIELQPVLDGEERVLRLRYVSGADSYKISERSLGFRWFFGFLLLTQFRKERLGDERQVLYVFDEPASNLHSSAQKKLLQIFGQLARHCPVLYSTHSHHLINPDWLESAYVVKNTGLTYEGADAGFSSKSTKIVIQRYRTFVASHKDQTTYYQPILDVLDYQPSHLELVPSVIFVEGKNDYYALRLAQLSCGFAAELADVKLVPGNGASGLDPLIQLYSGWGASFQILLDSDQEGTSQKRRYERVFAQLVFGRLNLLGDHDASFAGAMESMLTASDQSAIAAAAGQAGAPLDKSLLNSCIQECVATKKSIQLEKTTTKRFEKLLASIKVKLDAEATA